MHAQSCPTLYDPMDSPLVTPGSSVHGIFQARTLDWVSISFSGDFPDPRIDPTSPALPDELFTTEPLEKPRRKDLMTYNLSMHVNQSSHHIL